MVKQKKQGGFQLIEILISLGVVSAAALIVLPQISFQKKVLKNFDQIALCEGVVAQSFALLESGGAYQIKKPKFSESGYLNHPSGPLSRDKLPKYVSPTIALPENELVSLIPGKSMTFLDRFRQMGLQHRYLYQLRKGSNSDVSFTSPAAPLPGIKSFFNNQVTQNILVEGSAVSYKRTLPGANTPSNFLVDHDGVVLHTPLLMMGTVADIADLYNQDGFPFRGQFASVPDYLKPSQNQNTVQLKLQIERLRMPGDIPSSTSEKFWPLPRNQHFKPDGNSGSQYLYDNEIRGPRDDAWILKQTRDLLLATYENPAYEVSRHYGFRVTIKGEIAGSEDCQIVKNFFLPADVHNAMNYKTDFAFIQRPDPSGQATPPTPQPPSPSSSSAAAVGATQNVAPTLNVDFHTHEISDKFFKHDGFPFDPVVPPDPQDQSSSSINYKDLINENKNFASIFAGTNFGTPTGGLIPNAQYGRERPICSQGDVDGKRLVNFDRANPQMGALQSKEFTIRLLFKNLDKEPGVVPLCLNTSSHGNFLPPSGDQFQWCPGGAYAETYIYSDHKPGQGGWVPCEYLRLCGEPPIRTKITTNDKGDLAYYSTYNLYNDNNFNRKSRLWGCDLSFAVALMDPSGNLSYMPKQTTGQVEKPGILSVVPEIYIKPPPCYACGCSPCKKKKWYKRLWRFVVSVVSGGIIGGGTCLYQMLDSSSGGYCSRGNNSNQGDSRKCDENHGCPCGGSCSRINPPPAVDINTGMPRKPDLPPGFQDLNALGVCSYQQKTERINSIDFKFVNGARNSNAPNGFDTSATINYNVFPPTLNNPEGTYASVGEDSIFTMIDFQNKKFCYDISECYYEKNWQQSAGAPKTGRAEWKVKKDRDENNAEVDQRRCGTLKLARKMTKAGQTISINPLPTCLKVDYDNNLKKCSDFKKPCSEAKSNGQLGNDIKIDGIKPTSLFCTNSNPLSLPKVNYKDPTQNSIDPRMMVLAYDGPSQDATFISTENRRCNRVRDKIKIDADTGILVDENGYAQQDIVFPGGSIAEMRNTGTDGDRECTYKIRYKRFNFAEAPENLEEYVLARPGSVADANGNRDGDMYCFDDYIDSQTNRDLPLCDLYPPEPDSAQGGFSDGLDVICPYAGSDWCTGVN